MLADLTSTIDLTSYFHYADKLSVVGLLVLALTGVSRRFRWWVPVWMHEQQCQMWQQRYDDKCRECSQWRDLALGSMKLAHDSVKAAETVAATSPVPTPTAEVSSV